MQGCRPWGQVTEQGGDGLAGWAGRDGEGLWGLSGVWAWQGLIGLPGVGHCLAGLPVWVCYLD